MTVACSSTSQINYQSTKDPAYQRKAYQKIMVIARIDKADYRQRSEAALVQSLEDLDQKAITATGNLTQSYAQDSAAFINQLKSLGVDGVFVVNYLGEQTVVKDEWRYNGGVYFAYGGAYAPFDLDTKSSKVGYVQLHFYPLQAGYSQWRTTIPVGRSNGLTASLIQFSAEAKRRIRMDKLF